MALDPNELDPRPPRWWVAGLIAVIVIMAVNALTYWGVGTRALEHIGLEAIAALTLAAVIGAMMRRREARIGALSRDLTRSREEAARWREEAQQALQGLGAAIDRQFARWELTPAEREVALLLLKGLSLKEVADVRGTSERTARDQARSVYRKAGLSGRSELSAFFLEDLLLPEAEPVGAASRRGA